MTVKDKVGRKRYILVNTSASTLQRGRLIHLVNRKFHRFSLRENLPMGSNPPWLTVLDQNYAIFKCQHRERMTMVEFMEGLELVPGNSERVKVPPVTLKVLKVSGTIKKLKKKIESYKNIRGVDRG